MKYFRNESGGATFTLMLAMTVLMGIGIWYSEMSSRKMNKQLGLALDNVEGFYLSEIAAWHAVAISPNPSQEIPTTGIIPIDETPREPTSEHPPSTASPVSLPDTAATWGFRRYGNGNMKTQETATGSCGIMTLGQSTFKICLNTP